MLNVCVKDYTLPGNDSDGGSTRAKYDFMKDGEQNSFMFLRMTNKYNLRLVLLLVQFSATVVRISFYITINLLK